MTNTMQFKTQAKEVELLWFQGCANHPAARSMLAEVIAEVAPRTPIRDVDATDPVIAARLRFPGSPTIRVDGVDVDPGYVDPGDYTPRCRLYRTSAGLRGLPERRWIEGALRSTRSRGGPVRAGSCEAMAITAGQSEDSDADTIIGAASLVVAACCAVPLIGLAAGAAIPIVGVVVAAAMLATAAWPRRPRGDQSPRGLPIAPNDLTRSA